MKNVIIVLVLVFIFGCEKEANVKLPETKSVPVMYCYISPSDSIIRLKLTMSQPLYNSSSHDITASVGDAAVIISSGQGSALLVFNDITGFYEIMTKNYPVLSGQTYKLSVTLKDGTSASAETTVPQNYVPILNGSSEKITTNTESFNRLKINFLDEPTINNYYCLMAASIYTISPTDSIYEPRSGKKLYSDAGHNGELTDLSLDDYYYSSGQQSVYMLFLFNCNRDYYKLNYSLQNYTGSNPFSEPSLIYTNIKGGLGVFAAYTQTKYRITI